MSSADERIINRLQRIYDAQGAGGASFEELTGEPTDNAALGAALAAKGPAPSDTAYDETTWNGVTTIPPSKNAVRDKLVTVDAAIATKTAMLDTAGAPDNGVGANGDYAFDDATKTIYGPKAAGVWPAGVVLGAPAAPYLVYTALLTQTGINAPTATVLQNTLGGTVVWSYTSEGDYLATLAGAFTANKTFISATNGKNTDSGADGLILGSRNESTDAVSLLAFRGDGIPKDLHTDGASRTSFEIRVYP